MSRQVFEVWDYLVVGAMLVVSGAIGVYFRFSGDKQRTTDEYLMAGRNMGILPVTLSLMATVQTAVGTLGFPGEVYLYGAQLYLYPLGFFGALILCTFVHTPVYFGIQVTSAYEVITEIGKVGSSTTNKETFPSVNLTFKKDQRKWYITNPQSVFLSK